LNGGIGSFTYSANEHIAAEAEFGAYRKEIAEVACLNRLDRARGPESLAGATAGGLIWQRRWSATTTAE